MERGIGLTIVVGITLVGCSPTVAAQATATPRPTATQQPTVRPSPSSTPTPTPLPPTPTRLAPTPTFSQTDWANLPRLEELLLEPDQILAEVDISAETLLDWTLELESSGMGCSLDCAGITLQTGDRNMVQAVIRLLRLQNSDEAQQELKRQLTRNLDSVEDGSVHRYSEGELRSLRNLPPNSWLLGRTLRDIVLGSRHGPVVLLMEWSYDFCTTLADGSRYCEGDVANLATMAVELALAQLRKLEAAGYPP